MEHILSMRCSFYMPFITIVYMWNNYELNAWNKIIIVLIHNAILLDV